MLRTRTIIFLNCTLHIYNVRWPLSCKSCRGWQQIQPGTLCEDLATLYCDKRSGHLYSVARPLLWLHLAPFLVPQEYWWLSSLQKPQEKKSSSQIIKYYYEPFWIWGFLLCFYFTVTGATCAQDSLQCAWKSTNCITWTFGNAAPIKDSWYRRKQRARQTSEKWS